MFNIAQVSELRLGVSNNLGRKFWISRFQQANFSKLVSQSLAQKDSEI